MKLSVIISTYNRAPLLRSALESLEQQSYDDFEIVVVDGPSTDKTHEILERYAPRIKLGKYAGRNLSVSRNIGIDLATGDVVAFIDDDSMADRSWLADLATPFADANVGAAGGLVFDRAGRRLQSTFTACDRLGLVREHVAPPFESFWTPDADPFLYLQGTNMAFRREILDRIGGFNEEFEYHLDDVEACMRVTDLGLKVLPLENAIVLHGRAASELRNEHGAWRDVYFLTKNQMLFALRAGRLRHSEASIEAAIGRYIGWIKDDAAVNLKRGRITQVEYEKLIADIARADADARRLAGRPRPLRKFQPPPSFLKFERQENSLPRQSFTAPHTAANTGAFDLDRIETLISDLARRSDRAFLAGIHAIFSEPLPLKARLFASRRLAEHGGRFAYLKRMIEKYDRYDELLRPPAAIRLVKIFGAPKT